MYTTATYVTTQAGYNTFMRFAVPQFIEIEDKIFGPFTWKQFVYLCGGIGVAAVTFLATPIFIFALIGIPASGIAFLLAFYPVNNRPFSIFLESVFSFYSSNRIYHWRRKKDNIYSAENHTSIEIEPQKITVPKRRKGGINSLARQLELNALQKSE
jgi:hypothetical protein